LDGDADRCVLVDEKGTIIDGDMILALCAKDLKERGLLPSNRVVATVMSNVGLERFLAAEGIDLVRTQVGDRYVLEEMLRSGAELGGEQSGHTIFGASSTTGDGIFTALTVLSIIVRKQKPLSELLADFVRFPQKLVNINVTQKVPLDTLPSVTAIIKSKEEDLKGCGRVLVRYSGTENKVRVMVEAESEDQCRRHVADIASVIEREIGVS
jgi:phosphoglucosamine mutase